MPEVRATICHRAHVAFLRPLFASRTLLTLGLGSPAPLPEICADGEGVRACTSDPAEDPGRIHGAGAARRSGTAQVPPGMPHRAAATSVRPPILPDRDLCGAIPRALLPRALGEAARPKASTLAAGIVSRRRATDEQKEGPDDAKGPAKTRPAEMSGGDSFSSNLRANRRTCESGRWT